jgi:hypothetical protein
LIPSPTLAAEISQPVSRFLSALIGNDRVKAASLVNGSVQQAVGQGLTIVGGPLAGHWSLQIVPGKSAIPASEAFSAFASCNFWKLDDIDARFDAGKAYNIFYFCADSISAPPTAVYFSVKQSAVTGKVEIYNLGHLLITVASPPAPKGS